MGNKSKAHILTKSFLLKHYVKLDKSAYDIAKEFPVSPTLVKKYLVRFNIPRHPATKKAHARVRELSRLGLTKKRPEMRGENNPAKRPEVREKIRLSKLGKKNGMYGRRGKLSPRYVHGNSSEEKLEWGRAEWKEWRRKVFERDRYICRMCGYDKGKTLHAHHIKRRKDRPDLKYVVSNGVTLCKSCHHIITGRERTYEKLLTDLISVTLTLRKRSCKIEA